PATTAISAAALASMLPCLNCGEVGHWIRNCPLHTCHECGQKGHFRNDCPNRTPRASAPRNKGTPPRPRTPGINDPTIGPCRLWTAGYCHYGDQCRFYHDPSKKDLQRQPTPDEMRTAAASRQRSGSHDRASSGQRNNRSTSRDRRPPPQSQQADTSRADCSDCKNGRCARHAPRSDATSAQGQAGTSPRASSHDDKRNNPRRTTTGCAPAVR
ncbi:MAG: hypothetical protein GY700_04750, partial [Propionibacteriaceae bacterium]|nr:hypothetical protein [Propionibacteriaceae bacterium]